MSAHTLTRKRSCAARVRVTCGFAAAHEWLLWVLKIPSLRKRRLICEQHGCFKKGICQFVAASTTVERPDEQDNTHPHVAKTIRDFCSAQHMQLLPYLTYLPDKSPIEHVWDLVGRCLARDPRPAASKDELLLRIQAIWNSLPQADIRNLFDSMARR
ncbi:hypothetical protein TNCV_1213221 [Trichonephila clavipes]|nr:hypothetical protein TNCV_1213221 [Trichonephila clavipes]